MFTCNLKAAKINTLLFFLFFGRNMEYFETVTTQVLETKIRGKLKIYNILAIKNCYRSVMLFQNRTDAVPWDMCTKSQTVPFVTYFG